MKLTSQSCRSRQAQGGSTPALAHAPGTEGTTVVQPPNSSDGKMAANVPQVFAAQHQSRQIPGAAIALNQPRRDQRIPQTFEQEGLRLAPAWAVHDENTMPVPPSPDEAAQSPERGEHSRDKNALLIAAPRENGITIREHAVIKPVATSSVAPELPVSHANASRTTDWQPPVVTRRTPAHGYTIRAGNKGLRAHSNAPGAIAVTRRALGNRPADGDDMTWVLDSEVPYSTTADETVQSSNSNSGSEALSTSGLQGYPSGQIQESLSHLSPEMREFARNQLSPISVTPMVSSEDVLKSNEKSGITARMIWIVIGILVLVIVLATGLALGLDGNDESSTNSGNETVPPTLPGNVSFYQSLVEDFYDDGGMVFEDMNSPQYQALVWLASDQQSESLEVDRIRTLYALAVFYYSTNGEDFMSQTTWVERYGFLDSTSADICSWNNGDRNDPKGVWCDQSTQTKVEKLSYGK